MDFSGQIRFLKTITFYMSMLGLFKSSTELPNDIDRYTYCESCLATAREFESILATKSRQEAVDRLVDGTVCKTVAFGSPDRIDEDEMRVACKNLLDVYAEQFRAALLSGAERLDLLLCYDLSLTCVGVIRKRNQNNDKAFFVDSDLEALLRENRANVRAVRPIRSNLSMLASKEEL